MKHSFMDISHLFLTYAVFTKLNYKKSPKHLKKHFSKK